MSDLVATNCGCGGNDNNCCSSIIWIILLLCLCGNSGSAFSGDGCGCGGGNNSCIWIILLLLFFNFRSITYSLVVFSTVPLSLIGGIVALWIRGLPFSISAGVGFIALFGVAVLNGILMINHFNDMQSSGKYKMCTDRIIFNGCKHQNRICFLTFH